MFAQSFEMSSCGARAWRHCQCHLGGAPGRAGGGTGDARNSSACFFRLRIASFSSFLLSQSDCHNYPRVFSSLDNDTRFLLCGTNAFSPRCRFYFKANPWSRNLVLEKEFSGRGFCPYDPRHNSTALFTGK